MSEGLMLLVGLDCETWLIEEGGGAPPVVCFGWEIRQPDGTRRTGMITHKGEQDHTRDTLPGVTTLSEAVRLLLGMVTSRPASEARLVNQTPEFDFAVLCQHDPSLLDAVFAAYAGGWIECTKLREQLLDLAEGSMGFRVHPTERDENGRPKRTKKGYSLADHAKHRLGVELDKLSWRLGYRELHDVPLASWPEGARKYVCDDVTSALDVWEHQKRDCIDSPVPGEVPNSVEQAQAAFALQLVSWWGIRTDRRAVNEYRAQLDVALKVLTKALEHAGLVRPLGRSGIQSKNLAAIRELMETLGAAVGRTLTRTSGGEHGDPQVATNDEAVSDLCGDVIGVPQALPEAVEVAGRVLLRPAGNPGATVEQAEALCLIPWHTHVQKMLGTYVDVLEEGLTRPIMPRYETLKDNGRTSATKNIQTLPKERGARDCHAAREGTLLCSVDYEGLELHTLAQVALWKVGKSALADALNEGRDVHTYVMVPFLDGLTYEQAVAARAYRGDDPAALAVKKKVTGLRSKGKILNFGLGGGMGPPRLQAHFKKNGILITLDEAKQYRDLWFRAWPEMKEYHRIVGDEVTDRDEDTGAIQQFMSTRIRGGARFTEIANGYFSGLANDGAKAALFALQRAAYVPGGSLYGSRTVVFLHDEAIMEHPEVEAHERAFEQARIMCEVMQRFVPDVRIKAKPALMRRWHKDAEDVYDPTTGRLIPWVPKE